MKYKFLSLFILIVGFYNSCKPKYQNQQLAFNINKESNYNWHQTDTTIALKKENTTLWQYNYNTQKGRPFFHPITINNTMLTALSPSDHPWHLGLWHSWKYIDGVNYWEYNQSDGIKSWQYIGQTEIQNIKITPETDFSCQIELDIVYHKVGEQPLLREKRIIEVSSPDVDTLFYIDYNMQLTALAETVTLDRTPLPNQSNGKILGGYAGLSLRFNTNLKASNYINADESTDLKHGQSQPWTYYGLRTKTSVHLGVALFDHLKSFNYPTPWYVTNIKEIPLNYIGSAPLFNASHELNRGEQLIFKHRVKFYLDTPSFVDLKEELEVFKSN